MPEAQYETAIAVSRERVWAFVKDMDNWAPMLTGYQSHEKVSETRSVWSLRGDVGILSRMVVLEADVTEWAGPGRVAFTLHGKNESVDGGGELEMFDCVVAPKAEARKRPSLLARLFAWLFSLMHGKRDARPQLAAAVGTAGTKLRFTLRMEAGGPTGPLVNAMLGPAMGPATEDLAEKIAAHLEKRETA